MNRHFVVGVRGGACADDFVAVLQSRLGGLDAVFLAILSQEVLAFSLGHQGHLFLDLGHLGLDDGVGFVGAHGRFASQRGFKSGFEGVAFHLFESFVAEVGGEQHAEGIG